MMKDLASILKDRSGEKCELCGSTDGLGVYQVEPSDGSAEQSILLCSRCQELVANPMDNVNHWHCLNDTMWSPEPAVQAMAYRILKKISSEGWPQDMLDMLYLEPSVQEWAEAGLEEENQPEVRDANGTLLQEGDSVSIIKDLPVKGAGFTAKQGTAVKNIRMVADDPTHIQGRVNGTLIYLKTEFLKKL
jgi:protein PhnA